MLCLRKCCIVIFGVLMINGLSGCAYQEQTESEQGEKGQEEKLILRDLAFDRDGDGEYKIEIDENGTPETYLVLTDDYNGNCLLLREYLLDEPMPYHHAGLYCAYYEDSDIDHYLNGEFLERFSEEFQERIEESTIVITAKESMRFGGDVTTAVDRKVFFLSYTEVGYRGRIYLEEGEPLSYFNSLSSRIAYYKDGKAGGWWLRTPSTADHNAVSGISRRGGEGVSGVVGPPPIGPYKGGVRPAFCLKGDIPVMKQDDHYILAE